MRLVRHRSRGLGVRGRGARDEHGEVLGARVLERQRERVRHLAHLVDDPFRDRPVPGEDLRALGGDGQTGADRVTEVALAGVLAGLDQIEEDLA